MSATANATATHKVEYLMVSSILSCSGRRELAVSQSSTPGCQLTIIIRWGARVFIASSISPAYRHMPAFAEKLLGIVGIQAYKGSIGSTKIWSLAAERRRCSRLERARISNLRISMDVDGCVGLERHNAQSLVTIPGAVEVNTG